MNEKNRAYYRKLWVAYPDVLSTAQFQEMLGICENFARLVIRERRICYFLLNGTKIMIPKQDAITFVLGDYYQTRNHLRARV